MKHERYMSWFREVVEMGWSCGLRHPSEILANYILSMYQFTDLSEPLSYEHIERFMIDTISNELESNDRVSLETAISYFNQAQVGDRINFGAYTRNGKTK